MFLVGGTCFHLIGKIGSRFRTWNIARKCALCSLAVTAVEYVSGCLFNLRLKLNVWDYSEMPFNLNGQVCLLYTVLWGFLSATAMPLYRLFPPPAETGRFFPGHVCAEVLKEGQPPSGGRTRNGETWPGRHPGRRGRADDKSCCFPREAAAFSVAAPPCRDPWCRTAPAG